MEAGYDYLLLRGRFQNNFAKLAGLSLLGFGLLLIAAGGVYYGYAAKAGSDLDKLNVTLPKLLDVTTAEIFNEEPEDELQYSPELTRLLPLLSAEDISTRQLYPGEGLTADYWSNPWAYEPSSYREALLLQGFTQIAMDDFDSTNTQPAATRIRIPAIGVDSLVEELNILDMGGSRAYETPAHTVGHIPESANAGETGSAWFFGHTESPILGEGSVFFNLGKIPNKLRDGETVFIITDNDEQQFLYLVTSSTVISSNDMNLYDTEEATIHLVSCVPRWVYDHRLIITGELVAQKKNY